eukprot:CAMPEP_0168575044 /NCGR_PEP_ID=MMETSP0413-20121227/19436_1 /TAXON_ID=136452 /ORGANISM="Filamoeba nolandi, Strain NC-AS-23-1" /LENGTH=386 /DNA_ID=CAMNT_0008608491 /DNA_START=117 /DNA_END=1279 /DNA_ORIENTATION=-
MKEEENQNFASSISAFQQSFLMGSINRNNLEDTPEPTVPQNTPKKSLFQKFKKAVTGKPHETPEMASSKVSTQNIPVKVLLLGAGSQGKSTFAKQVKIMNGNGFIPILDGNIVGWIKTLAPQVFPDNAQLLAEIQNLREYPTPPEEMKRVGEILEAMEKEKNFKKALEWSDSETAPHRLANMNNFLYLMKERQRMQKEGYVPSILDVLLARVRTTGIIEIEADCGYKKFQFYDNGGERSERRKWMHCFENTNLVLVFVSLADYDMVLFEDHSTNRMAENLTLLQQLVSTIWFADCPVITVFTQHDIFKDKIRHVPISKYFPDFTGRQTYQEALQYFVNAVHKHYENADKPFHYVTISTIDTESVSNAWMVISRILKEYWMSSVAMD